MARLQAEKARTAAVPEQATDDVSMIDVDDGEHTMMHHSSCCVHGQDLLFSCHSTFKALLQVSYIGRKLIVFLSVPNSA